MSRDVYSKVRQEIIEAIKNDLIGPREGNEETLNENPELSYLTGLIHPISKESKIEFDYQEDINLDSGEIDSLGDEDNEDKYSAKYKQQNSFGVSFYLTTENQDLDIEVKWGDYLLEKYAENDKEGKERNKKVYRRTPRSIDFKARIDNSFKSKVYQLGEISKDSIDNAFYRGVSVKISQFSLTNNYKLVSVYITNNRIADEELVNGIMFQVETTIKTTNNFSFIPEYLCRKIDLTDEFLYESKPIFAHGHGCATDWHENNGKTTLVMSKFIPDHELPGVSPVLEGFEPKTFSMLFFSQAKNKIETIKRLKKLYESYHLWINELKLNPKLKEPSFIKQGNQVIEKCEIQAKRIYEGIELLENNETVFNAFCFMNQAMHMQRAINAFSKKYGSGIKCNIGEELSKDNNEWRAFQIAFILLNLTGITDYNSEFRSYVDLLYFPTGGGKTEAYLGLMAFLMGYRRMNRKNSDLYNKDGGVTIILRYTLRLLTTQQRDRLTKMVIAAEILRQQRISKNDMSLGTEPFSVGFYVGGGVTPNNFNDFRDSDREPKKLQESIGKLNNQLITCPYCGKELKKEDFLVDLDNENISIHCSDENCYFFKYKNSPVEIPVYLVDEQIYRKCPTIVIATVDKFARLPWDPATNSLFGRVDRYCPKHGYIAIGKKHPKTHQSSNFEDRIHVKKVKPFFPPELIVQDELHLITGPLGTIYGAYEAAIEELCSIEIDGEKIVPKYIVSTATIKNAQNQIKSLYGRNKSLQFPADGLDIKDSYFIKEIPLEQNPFRKYIGVSASGKSLKTTQLRIYAMILQKTLELSEREEYRNYIDPYYTLIGYFNSIRELGGTVRLLQDDIPKRITWIKKQYNHKKERKFFKHKEITSRMTSGKIAGLLKELETQIGEKNFLDVAIATNMISVGLDIDRLGLMCVFGQPKQSSEYIQATSRIGRSFPGLVVTIYSPYRPRDMSHYENFKGYHSHIYRYVEGTTATPFSARARDRVLHALFISLARLSIEELAENEDAKNISLIHQTKIDEIINKISRRVAKVSPKLHKDVVDEINRFIDDWKTLQRVSTTPLHYYIFNTERGSRLMNFYGEPNTAKEKPTLNSMREVESSSSLYYYED